MPAMIVPVLAASFLGPLFGAAFAGLALLASALLSRPGALADGKLGPIRMPASLARSFLLVSSRRRARGAADQPGARGRGRERHEPSDPNAPIEPKQTAPAQPRTTAPAPPDAEQRSAAARGRRGRAPPGRAPPRGARRGRGRRERRRERARERAATPPSGGGAARHLHDSLTAPLPSGRYEGDCHRAGGRRAHRADRPRRRPRLLRRDLPPERDGRRGHRPRLGAGEPLALGARGRARHALPDRPGPGQARALRARVDRRRRRRPSPRVADLRAVGGARAVRREHAPALRADRLRARLRGDQRDRRRRLQVLLVLRRRDREAASATTTRTSASSGRPGWS